MHDEKNIQAVISIALAALMNYFSVILIPLIILILAMIIDYITGMAAAWYGSELNSKKGIKGIVKKISYMALVAVSMGIDWLIYCGLAQLNVNLGFTVFFGVLVAIWLIINEFISTLENLKKIGVPLPSFIEKLISKLKNTVEETAGKDVDNEKRD